VNSVTNTRVSICTTTGPGTFSCACRPGYSGDGKIASPCADTNECATTPCANGGQCADSSTDSRVALLNYRCRCAAGYSGDTCDTDMDECVSSPCVNGGACVNEVDAYSCVCLDGWEGSTCATDLDECASMPCNNAGVCTDSISQLGLAQDFYFCTCGSKFYGDNCTGDVATQPRFTFNTDIATVSTDTAMTAFQDSFSNGLAVALGLPSANRIIVSKVTSGSVVVLFYIASDPSGSSIEDLYAAIRAKASDGSLVATFSSVGLGMVSYDTPDDASWVSMVNGEARPCTDFDPILGAERSLYLQCDTALGADSRTASQACTTACVPGAELGTSCTAGPAGADCQNGGVPTGTAPVCACDCSGVDFEGDICETHENPQSCADSAFSSNAGCAAGNDASLTDSDSEGICSGAECTQDECCIPPGPCVDDDAAVASAFGSAMNLNSCAEASVAGGCTLDQVGPGGNIIKDFMAANCPVACRAANSGGPGGPTGPLGLPIPKHSYPLSIEFACNLMEVTYRHPPPPWLTGSYHPRLLAALAAHIAQTTMRLLPRSSVMQCTCIRA
jgi:Notch-like protein